ARLAFADAAAHLERALPLTATDSGTRAGVLLELGEARRKAGRLPLARATYLDAAALAQARGDHAGLARAALGLHAVGAKTGPSAEREQTIGLLEQAAETTGLAASLGEPGTAAAHLSAAVSQHHQVGAGAWARLSALEQARLDRVPPAAAAPNRFQRDGAVWHITYHGTTIRVPDAKGLRDIAALLARPGEP